MIPRRRRIAAVLGAGALLAAAGVVAVALRTPAPETYTAGERVEGVSSNLARALPADAPALRFHDGTAAAGIRFTHFGGTRSSRLPEDMGPGAAWGDVDGDGDDDLFLPNFAGPMDAEGRPRPSGPTHALFRNRGDGTFEDVTAASGLGVAGTALGAAFADADGDGDLDLAVTQFGRSRLWINRGDGTFADESAARGLDEHEGFWTGASWADFDADGDLDVYVCGYVRYAVSEEDVSRTTMQYDAVIPFPLNPSSFPPERNLLLVNDGGGRFADGADAAGVANPAGRSLSAAWADYDEDGDLDLYVANDISDNALYLNRGDGTFHDASHEAWVADYRGAMGLAVGDPDGDLDLDIVVTHWIAQENALYRSMLRDLRAKDPGAPLRFVDVADREGLGQISLPMVGWGTELADFDGDGRVDLLVVNGSTFQERDDPTRLVPMRNFLFWNGGDRRGFFDLAPGLGEAFATPRVGRGAAVSDFDGDGDVDVLVAHHGGSPTLLVNDSGNARSWLGVRLSGTTNRFGVGARVEVECAGRRQVRLIGGSSSYLSQSSLEATFGLGDAAHADVIEVRWTSGRTDVVRDVPARSHVVIEEGGTFRIASSAGARAPAPIAAGPATSERAISADGSLALTGQAGLADASELGRDEKRAFWAAAERAQAARRRGDLEGAVAAYRDALRILPRHDDTLYWLGNCTFELGRHADALDAWTRLVEANPLSARGNAQLGVLHSTPAPGAPFDLQAAEDRFRRALAINAEESGPMTRLGEILVVRGKDAEALAILSAAARLNPKAVSAHYLLAHLRASSDGTGALADLGRAAKALETDAPVVRGSTSEGDTQARLRQLHAAALRRSLFGPCWEGLRERVDPAGPRAAELDAESRRIREHVARLREAERGPAAEPAQPRPSSR